MTVGDFSFGIVVLCYAAGFLLSFSKRSIGTQRSIYWTCTGVAVTFSMLATYPTWKNAVPLAILSLGVMTGAAFVATPYIKIRGKIYAFTITDPDPEDAPETTDSPEEEIDLHPDSYSGVLTATTMWWGLVVLGAIATANVYAAATGQGETWVGLMSGTFYALLTIGTAYGDASWRYPIARGQYIPFVVNTVITAGVFYFLYVAAYYAGQRHPLRRKQSMEYRAHPRHREVDD